MENILKPVILDIFSADIVDCIVIGGGAAGGIVYKLTINKPPYYLAVKTANNGELISKEIASIRYISKLVNIKLPKVYYECYNDNINYVVMEYFDGVNCADKFLIDAPIKVRLNVAKQIADNITVLQNIKGDKYGDLLNPCYDNWHDYYYPFVQKMAKETENLYKANILDKNVVNAVKTGIKHYDFIFSEPISKPTLIHGDYWAQNIIIDKNYNLIGVVDPFNSMWADAEYELFALNAVYGDKLPVLEAFLTKTTVSNKFLLKSYFYYLISEIYWVTQLHHDNNDFLTNIVKHFNIQLAKYNLK